MNDLILGYVRITWYATLFCMRLLIASNLRGDARIEAENYCRRLIEAGEQLDEIADSNCETQ